MAFEQMRAFLAGQAQDGLGQTTPVGPDNYPLLPASELQPEHEIISELINSAGSISQASEIRSNATLLRMCQTDPPQRTRYCWALIERAFAYDAKLSPRSNWLHATFFDYGPAAEALSALFEQGVEHEKLVGPLLEWFTCYRFNYFAVPAIEKAVEWMRQNYTTATLPDELRRLLIAVRGQFSDVVYRPAQVTMALEKRTDLLKYPEDQWLEAPIDALIGKGPWLALVPCEVWASEALEQLNAAPPAERDNWLNLLNYCHSATTGKPTSKWLKEGLALLDAIGMEPFAAYVIPWFLRVNEARIRPTLCMAWETVDERQRMHELNSAVLRGLLWLSPTVARPDLIRAIAKVCFSAYRKVQGLGLRAVKVGNAAVYALSQIDDPLALSQLALLKIKVKIASPQKAIETAFTRVAERSGLSREEFQEMSVPTYGLTDVGLCEEKMGEFTARLSVTGTHSTELTWVKPDGLPQRAIPPEVRTTHAEQLKELQAAIKDIQKMLPVQRDRMDSLFLQQRSWPINVWRERYLDHPLVGTLARRLLWDFTEENFTTTGIWHQGKLVDLELKQIAIDNPSTTVRLWHPIGKHAVDIAAWRDWLETHQIQQPFKQAHREIYTLTDAERRTRTCSNRFAGHVLKQHQFHALCGVRGWKSQLRLMPGGASVPASRDVKYPPPSLELPQCGLRAEFWIEGMGEDYGADGADTTESGVYLRLETDQVRFYRLDTDQSLNAEPVPLEEVPPLIFSEVMRDVDLFVAVSSIGNDPTWFDGGPQRRHRDYCRNFSFGELNATASTRKQVLQSLMPRLRIADVCTLNDRFLVVKGSWRTYKIHLGTGNILMEPNNQHLCLVPGQNDNHNSHLLPFEGDPTLSLILSKAFFLANDTRISDANIVSQLKAA